MKKGIVYFPRICGSSNATAKSWSDHTSYSRTGTVVALACLPKPFKSVEQTQKLYYYYTHLIDRSDLTPRSWFNYLCDLLALCTFSNSTVLVTLVLHTVHAEFE